MSDKIAPHDMSSIAHACNRDDIQITQACDTNREGFEFLETLVLLYDCMRGS